MKMTSKCLFMGLVSRPSFKDPSKMTHMVGFADGIDSLRIYVDDAMCARFSQIPQLTKLEVEIDYSPNTQRMNILSFQEVDA